ncbi:hypothetical protein [Ancylomarina longa]|uniref:Uncharacterized protein n=1 Tax=Ancylomarina longa TaxID=2487017 RepID=A0A434AT92_9BACT|nr:hypothetical protein [Ancylomarina longa]RUT77626.1 hypothetical protein DLK05_11890 [Ancylomarina longa]
MFPLFCPVREKDWLHRWAYRMIFLKSGFAEKDCVFATLHQGAEETIWFVTKYKLEELIIEFVRHTLDQEVVKISIHLIENKGENIITNISYQDTVLNKERETYMNKEFKNDFAESMIWWGKAINYYLRSGKMLIPNK